MKVRNIFSLAVVPALLGLGLVATPAHAGWQIDDSHSAVNFTVRHMMVTNVRGEFSGISGTVDLDDGNISKSKVDVSIDIATVDTRNKKRDDHLRSGDFFDAGKYPKARFVATSFKKAGKKYKVTGKLTLRGVTKTVVLDTEISQTMVNPWGQTVRGIHAETTIKRSDFGISWNKALDKGGMLVGDEVKLSIDMELVKK